MTSVSAAARSVIGLLAFGTALNIQDLTIGGF